VIALAHIREFTQTVAPQVFERGQGYERAGVKLWLLEVAWYREDEFTWMLDLAVESPRARVQTPADTSFQCYPSFARPQQLQSLSTQLTSTYREMLHTAQR
jgi:hypothetical protein